MAHELTTKQIEEIAFAVLRSHNDDRLWRALTYDTGPYDVTKATLALQDLASAFFRTGLATKAAQPSAKPLKWSHAYADQWLDEDYGFSIMLETDSETPYSASWGEGDAGDFATLEAAQAWCQAEIDAWVRSHVVVTPAQPSAQGEAVAFDRMEVRAIVQQAYMALEELQGPGFLIGGRMSYRIGLILPKLNAAIDAIASAPAAPAQDR